VAIAQESSLTVVSTLALAGSVVVSVLRLAESHMAAGCKPAFAEELAFVACVVLDTVQAELGVG
jgi:hypothetical protein